MDKRTLFGGGAAGTVALLACVGGWLSQSRPAASLDTPLPPGAVEITAADAEPSAPPAPKGGSKPTPKPSATPTPVKAPTPTPAPPEVVVHVTGAVKQAGVYRLKLGDRIESAILAAGGFKDNAQQDALNLADFVRDGDQLNVPVISTDPAKPATPAPLVVHATGAEKPALDLEKPGRVLGKPDLFPLTPQLASAKPTDAKESKSAKVSARDENEKFKTIGDGTVSLNRATVDDLMRLPGVGESTAAKILDYRRQHGSFRSLSQLQDISGIGPKKFARMKPFLTVN